MLCWTVTALQLCLLAGLNQKKAARLYCSFEERGTKGGTCSAYAWSQVKKNMVAVAK